MNPTIIALLISALLGSLVLLSQNGWRNRATRRNTRAAANRGHQGEAEAAQALESIGFTIIERHPVAHYDLLIDDQPKRVRMTADYLVARDGQAWIVEVKTGAGARPATRNTRRQLLEYAHHYPVAGVYLFNADTHTLSRVQFPLKPSNFKKWLAAGLSLGIILGYALGVLTH